MTLTNNNQDRSFLFTQFKAFKLFINFGSALFACRSFTKTRLVYKVYAGHWILYITSILIYTLSHDLYRNAFSMDILLFVLLYIFQTFTHLIVILESLAMSPKCSLVNETYVDFEKRFNKELCATDDYRRFKSQGWRVTILCGTMVIAGSAHIIISLTVYELPILQTIAWHGFLSSFAMQFRILELITHLTGLNEFAIILRDNLNEMGERNIRRVFGPYLLGRSFVKGNIIRVKPKTSQPSEEEDERKLRVYKKFYGEIYIMFKTINESYGWSLLFYMMMYFIYVVINSYQVVVWLILVSQKKGDDAMIRSFIMLMIGVAQLWILCWQCQNSHEQSRQIGCNMYKLVKPSGNKSYNELVTDFSLQVLHQEYTITAKEFFNLNLNLLGSVSNYDG